MPDVHKGVPLIMACRVGTHPGRDRLLASVADGRIVIGSLARLPEEFGSAQFHVVHPVGFLVDVRRAHGGCLAASGLQFALAEGGSSLLPHLACQLWIVWGKDARAQCKAAGKLACRAGHARGVVHTLSLLLRLSRTEVDGTTIAGTASVIGPPGIGQAHAYMVTVVGYLVVHLARRRVHAVEPLHAPGYLVHDIGHAVFARQAIGPIAVGKSAGIPLPGEHHLIGGVGRGGGILQAVRGIVPTAAHVDEGAVLGGVTQDEAVLLMTGIANHGVPSASLLTHIVQDKVGRTVVRRVGDGKVGRPTCTCLYIIGTFAAQAAKVEAGRRLHPSHRPRHRDSLRAKGSLAGEGVHQTKFLQALRLLAHEDRHLGLPGQIAQLVDTYPRLGTGVQG